MPETTDIPVDLPSQYKIEFGPVGCIVIATLTSYGAVSATKDATRKVKSLLAARKARKELEAQANTPAQ
jgi:hypothetical protein